MTYTEKAKIHYVKDSFLSEDNQMQEIMRHHIDAEVDTYGSLDSVMKEFVILAALSANHGGDSIREHVEMLLDKNVSASVIREVIYHCIPYAGILPVQDALKELYAVFKERDIVPEELNEKLEDAARLAQGYAIQCTAFPVQAIQKGYKTAKEDTLHMQKSLSAHCFGDFYTRKGLDLKQRELLTFAIIASIGGCESQLKAHTGANIRVGNTREELLCVMTCLQPYIGYPRTLNAFKIIDEITLNQEGEKNTKKETLFPLGEKNDVYAQYFIGQSYLNMLVEQPFGVANVTFEPGCRNNWHIHHKGGQILLVTSGTGWYQEWGKEAQRLQLGDVVNILPEVKHWHGAANDSWFTHIAIEVPADGASNEWLAAVDDEEYLKLK